MPVEERSPVDSTLAEFCGIATLMVGLTAKRVGHQMTCPHHAHGTCQGEQNIGDQYQAVAEANDGVVARAFGQQGPDTADDHIA